MNKNEIEKQQLQDIHQLLDLIECMNLVAAQPWWRETLQRIRHRYAGTDDRYTSQPAKRETK